RRRGGRRGRQERRSGTGAPGERSHTVRDDKTEMKVVYLAETEVVKFGPDATYQPILGDPEGRFPIRTGIQTSQPGYQAPLHSHPYIEVLHVLEARAEAWLEGQEADPVRLGPGDTIAIPAETLHPL